ncbi:aldose 1-epimerase family protein [Fructilactobacillus sp. Tb1]|uniref:aldose 1-epimerase family protein n=1 Tax=Fructilactobacillus sp. Tb1 TaxID=3422304 RepID=UPI003D2C1130
MVVTLKNSKLTVKINEIGAELISVQNPQGIEYIWGADPEHWKRHAPILFPMVGRLKNDEYSYDGSAYTMYQHGFARDSKFEIVTSSDEQVIFLLKSDVETMKAYPFKFEFYVSYTLAENMVKVSMLVKNRDHHSMYFSVGAHPGFKVPLESNETYDDYEVIVTPEKEYPMIALDGNGLTTTNKSNFNIHGNPIPINHELFKDDARIFDVEANDQTTFTLKSKKSQHGAAVTAYKNQYFGLWSTYPVKSDFVCIEPWWGIADSENSTGFIRDKNDISRLRCGEDFAAKFDITFF